MAKTETKIKLPTKSRYGETIERGEWLGLWDIRWKEGGT